MTHKHHNPQHIQAIAVRHLCWGGHLLNVFCGVLLVLAVAVATASTAGVSTAADGSGRPRVCILGGGFGGLYTAIKLELLMWPKGKKPQVGSCH